jgi:hypothetical protein
MLIFSARWNLPSLAAATLNALQIRLPLGAASSKDKKYRVLILNFGKDEFFRDLEEIFREDRSFELVAWPAYALQSIARTILAPSLKHNAYVTEDPTIETTKEKYLHFISEVWKKYQTTVPTDAVISANFGYCVQREFAAALENQGTPFLVVQKENFNAATPERRQIWHSIYKNGRGKFGGRKILVYNEMERELEIESGVASAHRVEVVGMPRLDRFHRLRREIAEQGNDQSTAQALFFSFSRVDKIPKEVSSTRDWGSLFLDTHRAILDLAKSRRDIRILAKTKGIGRQDDEPLRLLRLNDKLPPNVSIVSGGDAFPHIVASRVVIGFNTTGILEALALGKPVVVPCFAEALDPFLGRFIIDLGEAVHYAESPRHLQELIGEYASRPPSPSFDLTADVQKILDVWIGNNDGHAGMRAYNSICDEVTRSYPAQS